MENPDVMENFVRILTSDSEKTILENAAGFIAGLFSVTADEVAILKVDNEGILNFAWPIRLRHAGSVPISAFFSLVAKTARERKSCFNNAFATTPHASFFETFRVPKGVRLPIQKIISVPVSIGEELVGVIQVSRKGESRLSCSDFSFEDLGLLERLGETMAPFF